MDFDYNCRCTGISLSDEGHLVVMTLNNKIFIIQIEKGDTPNEPITAPKDGITIQMDDDGLFEEVVGVEELPSEAIMTSNRHRVKKHRTKNGPRFQDRYAF